MRINPKILGINTNASNIANQIKTNKISPKMIINEEEGNEVASITQAITGDNNIYGKIILPSVPNFLIIPNKNTYSSFILIDDVLIISEINTKDLELISPIVSHLFVSDYFGNKYVKSYPVITVLNDNEFQKYRQKENEKKIIEIDKQLLNIKNYISTISAAIKNDNRQILINKSDLNDQQDENNLKYEKCLKYYDINYCKTIINNLNKNSDTNNSDLEEWRKQLEFDESLLKAYKYYDEFFKLQRANLENFKYIIHNEQGVFEPENNIKARVDSKEANSITTFFSVVIHEYFHYASYKKGKKFTNSFFEEGLTEYFSRQVIKHNLGVSTNLGYPIQSKIISQIAQKIAENELIGIYFSKDDNLFAQAMDRVYGDGFYEKNKITFEALQYATTPQELTKLANDIMVQIGGTKISEKDYYSSSN